MVTKLSSLLRSDTTRSREREDVSQRNRFSPPYQLGISSGYKRDEGYESDPAGHLLHSKPVSDNTRPSQDQEGASPADCKESFKLVQTVELVDAPKSGGSYGTSSSSSRLDLGASPSGVEIPSDETCQLKDAFKMMDSMDPNPADIVSTGDAPPIIEREVLPSSSLAFSEITQTRKTRKCSNCRANLHSRRRCPLLPCRHCAEMGHLTSSCPFKAGRYSEGKTRANADQIKRRGPYHTKRSLDAAIKGKGGKKAKDPAEARRLDPAWIRKSREHARALDFEAKKAKARLKYEAEKDGDCGSLQHEKRQKEAKRQYDLKRYANPAVREKVRARYREAAKAKDRLKSKEESNHDDPSFRMGRPIDAKRQQNAKRQRDPAAKERRGERKRLRHEAIEPIAEGFQDDEAKYDDDDDNEKDDSEPAKTPIPTRESRADLGDELDRLKETDIGLAEAIIGFHRRLETVLETRHGRDQRKDLGESRIISLSELSSTDAEP